MIERRELLDSYSQHLDDTATFTLAEALNALECYSESRIENVNDVSDRLMLLTGVFSDEPDHYQISLNRHIDFFTGLSVRLMYRRGLRSLLTPSTSLVSRTGKSDAFFSDIRASWNFRMFRNVRPFRVKIDYQDADDKPDGYYDDFLTELAPVLAEM